MIRLTYLLIAVLMTYGVSMSYANAQSCEEITHTFSSGANWRLCARIDDDHGLSLSDIRYFAPGDASRVVLQALHPAQILIMQHSKPDVSMLLGQSSQHLPVPLDAKTCEGELLSLNDNHSLCTAVQPLPLMAKYGSRRALQGEAFDVFSVSAHDSLIWRSNVKLTEDGRITPSISLSGLRANDLNDATATLQTTWRMAFALNGSGIDDSVEQFDFPLNRAAGNRRAMTVKTIPTESFGTVAREDFRGWRVLDQSGAGYYLDPQNSGYQTVSSSLNWAKFDLAITAFNHCEQLAEDNQKQGCERNLDGYISGESLDGVSPVLWYSQSRIYRPRSEDNPVITSLHTEFELLPFDWTKNSPFEALD